MGSRGSHMTVTGYWGGGLVPTITHHNHGPVLGSHGRRRLGRAVGGGVEVALLANHCGT